MKCRIDIKGRKIWVDDNNLYDTRPDDTAIILRRDGEIYKTVILDSSGDGKYKFPCLIVWKNKTEKYVYTVDELNVPEGYSKTIQGYNVINTLNDIEINGFKIWNDNYNEQGYRPAGVTIRLLQNGVEIDSLIVTSPAGLVDRVEFDFGVLPFADTQGIPYVYNLEEDPVANYQTTLDGFNITNTFGIIPFSFTKKNMRTEMSLQGASFEIKKNGITQATAISDANGTVVFNISGTGTFQLMETLPPSGFMDNIKVYEVAVASDGTITVDGQPAAGFCIENEPIPYGLNVSRATENIPAYSLAPNTWRLHGEEGPDLYMTDKILISAQTAPVTVKWDYGVRTAAYFSAGGGYDITGSYTNGIPVSADGNYTVYALFYNGYEAVAAININNLRNGSKNKPYLLLDYSTAAALEPLVTGIGQFILGFMQGGGVKLTQHYELYENVNMNAVTWIPLSEPTSEGFTGSFYGNGNDIENLSIMTSGGSAYNSGMFGRITNGGVVESLGLINCTVQNTAAQAGGFAGLTASNNGGTTILRNLRFSGSVTSNGGSGGITANIDVSNGSVIIDNCTTNGVIVGKGGGGIAAGASVPATAGTVIITNCHTLGSCTATGTTVLNSAAGILGSVSAHDRGQFKIENCVSSMIVQSTAIAGGIIGIGSSAYNGLISSCYNRGKVTGVSHVGGIAGDFTGLSPTELLIIENCYNTAEVNLTANTSAYAGGIIGVCQGYINIGKCYNTGDITAAASGTLNVVGGIAGSFGIIDNCAAINALCSSPQINVARIASSPAVASQTVLNNNAAYGNMQVMAGGSQKTPLETGSTGKDGLDTTVAAIKTQGLYEADLGWDFSDAWSFGNGGYTLPVLKGIPLNLQPDILPSHLI